MVSEEFSRFRNWDPGKALQTVNLSLLLGKTRESLTSVWVLSSKSLIPLRGYLGRVAGLDHRGGEWERKMLSEIPPNSSQS